MARLLLLALLALSAPSPAATELQVRVAALVISEGDLPAADLARTREDVRGVLEASRRYRVLPPPPQGEALARRCAEDAACWRSAARAAGLEQLIVLWIQADDAALSARCAVYGASELPLSGAAPLPRGGGAPLDLLQQLLLDAGTLHLRSDTPGAQLWVNGEPATLDADAARTELALPAGKHHLRVEAPGYHSAGLTVTVLAGRATPVEVSLVEQLELHPWRRLGLTLGLAAGGAGLITGLLAAPDPARR